MSADLSEWHFWDGTLIWSFCGPFHWPAHILGSIPQPYGNNEQTVVTQSKLLKQLFNLKALKLTALWMRTTNLVNGYLTPLSITPYRQQYSCFFNILHHGSLSNFQWHNSMDVYNTCNYLVQLLNNFCEHSITKNMYACAVYGPIFM